MNDAGSIWHAAAFKRPAQLIHAANKEAKAHHGGNSSSGDANRRSFVEQQMLASQVIENAVGLEYNETLLHVACLYSNSEVAAFLIENFPQLINKKYQGIYAGETALHIAVVHGDVELIKLLLRDRETPPSDSPSLKSEVETRVEMFSPDQREVISIQRVLKEGAEHVVYERKTIIKSHSLRGDTTTTRIERQFATVENPKVPVKEKQPLPMSFPEPRQRSATMRRQIKADSNAAVRGQFFSKSKDGSVYFGDHPISFAVCLKRPERKEIIRLLIKHKARLDLQDRYGNTLLHLCVYHNDVEMYNYVCDLFSLYKSAHKKSLAEEVDRENKRLEQAGDKPVLHMIQDEKYEIEMMINENGRSPLNYAIELGRSDMVQAILTRRKVILWKYGGCYHSSRAFNFLQFLSLSFFRRACRASCIPP